MRIAFYTLGCKVNTYETESVWELFEQKGYQKVDHKEFSDVYVINTCTVTNSGDSKSRKAIRKFIKQNPEAVIAVMGCYSQMSANEVLQIDGVDIVIGTKHREQLVDLVEQFLRDRAQINAVTDVSRHKEFDEIHVTHFTENTRAFLKIQDGCNNFCSYCIIPFARGPVRSRPKDSVLKEAQELVNNGYLEIVLTGIHTGGYGSDLENYTFYDLLKELSSITGLKRLRISSIEINELTDEILKLISENDVFAKHLHIPLQSGSEEILTLMRRKYTKKEYLNKLTYIRTLIPNIAITTDVIVGFPSETDEMYEEMVSFIKECAFSELHVFPYSKRSGTKAAQMKNQINGITKSIRVNKLIEINEQLATNYIKTQSELSVLFEKSDDRYTYGHSDTYVYVKVIKDTNLHNSIYKVSIENVKYKDTFAKLL